jgi:outer membrane receptor for ferrienterochelin and colicin
MTRTRIGWSAWVLAGCLLAAWPALAAEDVAADDVFTLGEVIVSGEEQVVNLATTVTEVTAEDIKQRGARTLADALEMLPGVDVARSSKKNESFVQIRGFNDQDVKILIDGVPVYEQYSRQLDLSQIPTSSIAKITVTKGASSVLYGANAMGGVINIITKTASNKPTAAATIALGDYGTEEYSVSAGAPLGKFNYWLGYSYRHSDGWRLSSDYDQDWWGSKGDDGGKRDYSDYIQNNFNAKFGFEPDKDTSLYLTFDYHENEKGVPDRKWFYTDWTQWHLNLVGQKKFTDWLKVKARVFYADHDDALLFPWNELSTYDNYSVGGDLQSFMDFGRLSYLKFGFTLQRDNCKQETKYTDTGIWGDTEEYEADTYTIALEDEIKPLDWLALTFGISYDYYDPRKANGQPVPNSVDAFNPQAGVVVTLSENTMLHGSVGKKIRFPHLKELYSDWAGGNPDLDPQETITYEVGLNHAFNDTITLSVAAFYNDIKDLIESQDITVDDPTSDDPADTIDVSYYDNISDAVTKGVEVSLGADITDNFWIGLNYTYMQTEDKENNRELEGRPRHRTNLDLRYNFPFGLTTSAQLSYTNRQFYDNKGEWTRTPDFLLLNARIEQRLGELLGVEGKAFFEISNLTDRDYYEVGKPTPGRNFLAGLNFTY